MSWIFVQNPMQIDLVQYKVLHTTFERTRIRICISVQIIKHLEIGLSKPRKWCAFLFNVKIGYTARWHPFARPDYLVPVWSFRQSKSLSPFYLFQTFQ